MTPVLHSAAIDGRHPLKSWMPEDDGDVLETLVLAIGAGPGRKRSDDFHLRVATPRGLARASAYDGIVSARALLVLERYDRERIARWLEDTLAARSGDSWLQCVDALRRYMSWEYDGIPRA